MKKPEKKAPKAASAPSDHKPAKTKLTFKEKQEYDKLEPEIEVLEEEKSTLEAELNTGELDYELLTQKSTRVSQLIDLIDEKMQRWLELGQYA